MVDVRGIAMAPVVYPTPSNPSPALPVSIVVIAEISKDPGVVIVGLNGEATGVGGEAIGLNEATGVKVTGQESIAWIWGLCPDTLISSRSLAGSVLAESCNADRFTVPFFLNLESIRSTLRLDIIGTASRFHPCLKMTAISPLSTCFLMKYGNE